MSGRKSSVLIVDDDRAGISALKNILSPDYIIYASCSGQDAVETANDFIPDIILLDVIMPDMDGYDVIKALKGSEKTKDIPVIFITGLDSAEDEEKGLACGASDYISKPFHPAIVLFRVRNQIRLVMQLRQQALMTKISSNFLIETTTVSLFTDTLRMVGEFMGIAFILLYSRPGSEDFINSNSFPDEDNNVFVCRTEWKNPEYNYDTYIGGRVELNEQVIHAVNNKSAGNEKDFLFNSNDLLIRDYIRLDGNHFENYILAPVFIKGKICAILVFSGETELSKSETDLAVFVASFFSGVFERDAMQRQYSLIECSPNLILYISADTSIEYINPAVTAVTGYTSSELISKGLCAVFDEETLSDIKEKHIPDAMRGETVIIEKEIKRKDGEKRILMIKIIRTGNNNIGMLTIDMTKIRELENGLIAAREYAESLSHVKSEFLSRMSHEMRTPISIIIGILQILKMIGMKDDIKKYCENMNDAAHSLLNMIDDILDMSDMHYEVYRLSDSVFNFKTMISSVTLAADEKASKKRQLLNCNIDPEIPSLLIGDEKHLKQVIVNLLANAVKFTPEDGKISFNACLIPAEADNDFITLQIEVSDNGIGISNEMKNKLFSVFEQANGGSDRKYSGIGIGLPLSKRIIEMMGGKIWYESEVGKGTKFIFTCKLRKG